jgi:hypothetical protein
LYPAPLRDILLEVASKGLFRAKWTTEIQNEWIGSLLADRADLTRDKLERTRTLMNQSVPDCLVEGYEHLIASIDLPDPHDRHVVAAAIHAHCDAVITVNLKDFPPAKMELYGLEVQHPDDFLHHQFGLDAAAMIMSAFNVRKRLKNPSLTVAQYLDKLRSNSLTKTAAELERYAGVI